MTRPTHPVARRMVTAADALAAILVESVPGHENCEAPWYCQSCERPVCPRCEPSPAEFRLCAECDWNGGEAA